MTCADVAVKWITHFGKWLVATVERSTPLSRASKGLR